MNPRLEAIETTPSAAIDVRDYDELHDRAQAAFPEAVANEAVPIPEETARNFSDGEVVRFTGYYRVTLAQ